MGLTPSGSFGYGVVLCDSEGDFLGLLDHDKFDDEVWPKLKDVGLTVVLSGWDDCLCHVLAVADTVVTSDWGDVQSVDRFVGRDANSNEFGDAETAMREICEKYEIPFEPHWFITSLYF